MSIFEQASSRPGSRFGKLSSNMFFTRNTAKPKRVRHIEGLNGALICNVNDDASVVNIPRSTSLNFNRTNLPAFETSRRTERLVPPTGFWNTHGIIHDTERWKQELAALASASGIGLEKDDHKHLNKSTTATADQQHASRSGAHYSTRTGRFNEGTATSRGRTGSKHGTAYSDTLFNVPENEREMWMLQVLCQLLGTSHLEDVQSWLVSAAPAEKEQARTMINAALRGLKESERTVDPTPQSVDFNSLSNFVEKQQNEEKHVSHKFIQDTLNRSAPVLPSIDEEQHADMGLNGGLGYAENNNEHLKSSAHGKTTYGRAYHNFNQRSFSSFDSGSPKKNNDPFNENEEEKEEDNEEQIDTIHLDDDRQRPRSGLSLKAKVQTKKSQSFVERPPSSHKKKHRVESLEFTDNDNDNNNNNNNTHLHNKNETDDDNQQQDLVASSNKVKPLSSQDDQRKVRKIRDLQNKLSRQEEEAKKKFNELQSKQSRLENAIKLLSKQASSFKKRRQHKTEHVEDLDAPVVNVIIQSPRETDPRDKSQETISLGKQLALSTLPSNEKSKHNRNGNSNTKIGDYTIQDVKVQISLSRLDNHPAKVFAGVWKPDASTLHRLQGN